MDIMLDLETMGDEPDAAIIAIGAVRFDLSTGEIGSKFYEVVDLESSVAAGGRMTPSTVLWWMQQSDDARAAFERKGLPLQDVLVAFAAWLRVYGGGSCVWGNGAAFDNVILASAYRRCGMEVPWPFWADRCYRTIKALTPHVEAVRVGTYHNAIDDAETQARHLIAMLRPA